jgi:hypothetical protein
MESFLGALWKCIAFVFIAMLILTVLHELYWILRGEKARTKHLRKKEKQLNRKRKKRYEAEVERAQAYQKEHFSEPEPDDRYDGELPDCWDGE